MYELWNAYGRAPIHDRLWVLGRYAVCPWMDVVETLPATGRVLDVGCGRGLLAALVRRHRPGLAYVGVDPSERPVRIARRSLGGPGSEFHSLDPAQWSTLGRFDRVVMVDVLYAVALERWPSFVALCAELLDRGGEMVLKETVAAPRWKAALVRAQETMAIRVLRYTQGEPPHFEPEETYRAVLEGAGLDVTTSRPVDRLRPWPHHLFVARRRALST